MDFFDEQTVKDLEFDVIRRMLYEYCNSETAKAQMAELSPIKKHKNLKPLLLQANEFLRIKKEGYTFPRIAFIEIKKEIKLLELSESVLLEEGLMKILRASQLVNEVLQFFKGKNADFPELTKLLVNVQYSTKIQTLITKILNDKGKVKDEASTVLSKIRGEMLSTKRQANRVFNRELKQALDAGILADIREGFVNERRVLAVQSTYKRRVQGTIMGHSKTGTITFIEPKNTAQFNYSLELLIDDERKEIHKILRILTREIRPFLPLIKQYLKLLINLDLLQAKTLLALKLNGSLPSMEQHGRIELIDAFHPILFLTNLEAEKETFPQTLTLDQNKRILVISGPNAGGKSITLKMIGLLQVMLQSGLLIPVSPNSRISFFDSVLTDIGDNQSIENQLSTYSYRLKRMKFFLDVCNKKSLLLLDEFGTGSDPELGGALAEVFFETLYKRGCFGVITTHYANIKFKAAQLPHTINGSMLFDQQSLEPLFKLDIGQPGSSYTFEVAEINGIDPKLIQAAKAKLDGNKVRLDKIITDLQKEKSDARRLNTNMLKAKHDHEQALREYEKKQSRLREKEASQKEHIEKNNQEIVRGKKISSFIKQWNPSAKNKELLDEVKKYLAVEKTKILENDKRQKLKDAENRKKAKKKSKPKANQHLIKKGSLVRLSAGREKGTVIEIDDKFALVAFGVFKTKVEISKLKFVR